MSIVGTRPPLISETNLYEPHHKVRLKNLGFRLYYGSSWWSISDEFAKYYLEEAKKFIDIFSDKTFAIDVICCI